MGTPELARTLIFVGVTIAAVGLLLLVGQRLGLGRLPGDIHVQRGNWSFAFPIVTCLVISILLTILANLFGRR